MKNSLIKIGNIVLYKNKQFNSVAQEYVITNIESKKHFSDSFSITLSLLDNKDISIFPKTLDLSLNEDGFVFLDAVKELFEFTDKNIEYSVQLIVEDDIFFRSSSKDSLINYFGNIGFDSDGGYLIKEGIYIIQSNLNKLLEATIKHELRFSIYQGKLFIR